MKQEDVEMNRSGMFMHTEGVVVRQVTQKKEAILQTIGIPYEARNEYKVSLLPAGKAVAMTPSDPERWKPTAEELKSLEQNLFVREESSCMVRTVAAICGVLNLRPLTLHISVDAASGDAYIVDRPFNLGGHCCCPLVMDLYQSQGPTQKVKLGRVKENFDNYCLRCCQLMCLCTAFHDVQVLEGNSTFTTKYTIKANLCCYGRVNNCCGATCCKNDAVFDILALDGNVAATIQKTYGPGSGACCRFCYMYNNYVMKFPASSTATERALLMVALFQLDYHLFEKKGND